MADTYEDVLTKLMNVAEGARRDTVTREKAWLRDSEEYRKLFPSRSKMHTVKKMRGIVCRIRGC